MSTHTDERVDDLAKQKINDAATLTGILNECRSKGAHVLTPIQKIDRIAPAHEVSLVLVRLSDNGRDCYKDPRWDGNERALTHTSLLQLWTAVGGQWLPAPSETGTLERYMIKAWAAGRIKEPGGIWLSEICSRTLDYRDGSEQLGNWKVGQIKEARSRQNERAESFAKNRVIRKLLDVHGKYTIEELKRPFVAVRTAFQPDPNHPLDRMMMLGDAGLGTAGLFGSPAMTQLLEAMGGGNGTLALPETTADSDEPPAESHALPAHEETLSREDALLDFSNSDQADQVRTLEALISERAFDVSKLKGKPLHNLGTEQRKQLFAHLLDRPMKNDDLALDL